MHDCDQVQVPVTDARFLAWLIFPRPHSRYEAERTSPCSIPRTFSTEGARWVPFGMRMVFSHALVITSIVGWAAVAPACPAQDYCPWKKAQQAQNAGHIYQGNLVDER